MPAVLRVWSDVALPDPGTYYGGYKEPRVTKWGTMRRALSDDQGQYQGTEFTWTVSDADHLVRGLLAGATTQYFPNRSIVVRMITDPLRRALAVPRTVFRGLVRAYKPGSPRTFEFTARDYFDALFGTALALQQIPKRKITVADFPQSAGRLTHGAVPAFTYTNEHAVLTTTTAIAGTTIEIAAAGLPVPIIYGAITDTFLDGDGVDVGDGQCPAVFVGLQTLSDGPHYKWLIAGHACKGIDEIYVNNGPEGIATDVLMSGTGGHWKIPGYAGWTSEFGATPYEVISGRRYCTLYGKVGPDAAVTSSSVASPSVITATAHGLVDGQLGQLYGHAGSTPDLNGRAFIVHVTGANTFTFGAIGTDDPIAVTVGGFGGRVRQVFGPDIAAGRDKTPLNTIPEAANVPLALTVRGIDTVGDTTGALITEAFAQYLHCLANWIVGDYQTGAWLALTEFPDAAGLTLIDAASFARCATRAAARVPGGYRGDFILGASAVGNGGAKVVQGFLAARDLLAAFNLSFDAQTGFSRKSQFIVDLVDDTADVSATVRLTPADVLLDSLDITDDTPKLWNTIPFRHTRDYFGRMGTPNDTLIKNKTEPQWRSLNSGIAEVKDDDSITNNSADPANPTPFPAPIYLMPMVRGRNRDTDALDYAQGTLTATDVVARVLQRHKAPPRLVVCRVGTIGFDLDLGDLVRHTHPDGIGTTGWTDRVLRVVSHDADPGERQVTLGLQDVQAVMDDPFVTEAP